MFSQCKFKFNMRSLVLTVLNLSERECKCVQKKKNPITQSIHSHRTHFFKSILSTTWTNCVLALLLQVAEAAAVAVAVVRKKRNKSRNRIDIEYRGGLLFLSNFFFFLFFHSSQFITVHSFKQNVVVSLNFRECFSIAHYDFSRFIRTFINFYQWYEYTKPTLLQLHT